MPSRPDAPDLFYFILKKTSVDISNDIIANIHYGKNTAKK